MALILSAASGNFNAGATWVGGIVPGAADEARASTGHVVTITANVTCTEVSNDGTGLFVLNSGVTLTANVTNKSTTVSRTCLQFTANSPSIGTIVGNVTGGPVTSNLGINNFNTGIVSITGNVTGGSGSLAYGVYNSSTGTFSITGNVTGGSSTAHAVQNQGAGTITITGNAIAVGSGMGVNNVNPGTITITGNSTGAGTHGVNNASTGIVTITGIATAGTFGTGVNNASTGTVYLGRAKANAYGPGNSTGLSPFAGANNAGLGIIEIQQLEYGTFGMPPTTGTGIRLKKVSTNVAIFNYCDTAGTKTLIDATANAAMPAITDVRFGTGYASGALTGVAYIPAATSVAFGVPVDNTTGTAALTPASVWDHLLSAITTSSTIGTLLKTNIDATISSRSTLTAANVRTELTPELTEITEVHAIHGLDIANALTVTPTLRAAGAITQAITGDGTTSTIVTRV